MPEYNPAVALGLHPPENSLAQTFNTIANLQQSQAHTGLYTLQALQQQRQYNALQTAAQDYRAGRDPLPGYLGAGGDPAGANTLQTVFAGQRAMQATPGGLMPSAFEQLQGAREKAAQTSNLGVQHGILQTEQAKKDMEYRGGVAQSMFNDTSDENWNANVSAMRGHVSPQGWAQIQGAKTPEQRQQVAQSMINAAMPTAEFTKPVEYDPNKSITTPGRLMTAAGTAGAGGAAPAPIVQGLSPHAKELQTQTAAKSIDYLQGEGNKQYSSSQALLGRMTIIDHNIEALGPSWMGAGADTKANMAKVFNSTLDTFGVHERFHIDPAKIATWEEFNKEQTRAGMELINSNFGGSREAASIIQMGRSAVTGVQNSYLGAKYVSSSITAAAQRQSDMYEYQAQHPEQLPAVSAIAFNKMHPPQEYAMRAITGVIPQRAKQHLAEHPDLASEFNEQFGKGTAQFVLGAR